jgi:hypothetical protein
MTLNQPHFVNLYQLNIKRRKVHMIPNQYINMEYVKDYSLDIELFVLNTCGDNIPTEEEYSTLRKAMKERFPKPTPYEIINDIDEKIISTSFLNTDKTRNDSNKIVEIDIRYINNRNKNKNNSSTFLTNLKDEKNETESNLSSKSTSLNT